MVTLKDESTNERVDDRKASGRIPHNLEILANLGRSIAEDNTIYQFHRKTGPVHLYVIEINFTITCNDTFGATVLFRRLSIL